MAQHGMWVALCAMLLLTSLSSPGSAAAPCTGTCIYPRVERAQSPGVIIFIPGLRGDPETSFNGSNAKVDWPNLVAEDNRQVGKNSLSSYDIYLLKHEASGRTELLLEETIEKATTAIEQYITDKQPREVIIVAHSFGGLIAKRAFSASPKIAQRLKAIFLVAVPSNGHSWHPMLARAFGADALELAGTTSWLIQNEKQYANRFIEKTRGTGFPKIYCAFERKPLTVGITLFRPFTIEALVLQHSDTITPCDNPSGWPIDEDHRSIAKPTSHSDDTYRWFFESLKEAMRASNDDAHQRLALELTQLRGDSDPVAMGDRLGLALQEQVLSKCKLDRALADDVVNSLHARARTKAAEYHAKQLKELREALTEAELRFIIDFYREQYAGVALRATPPNMCRIQKHITTFVNSVLERIKRTERLNVDCELGEEPEIPSYDELMDATAATREVLLKYAEALLATLEEKFKTSDVDPKALQLLAALKEALPSKIMELAPKLLAQSLQPAALKRLSIFFSSPAHRNLVQFDLAQLRKTIADTPVGRNAGDNVSDALGIVTLLKDATSACVTLRDEFARRAKADGTREISLFPDAAGGYIKRGIGASNMDEPASAMADFKRALSLQPDNFDVAIRLVLTHIEIARRGGPKSHLKEAEKAAKRAIATQPTNPEGYLHLGDVLLEINRANDAVTALTKSIELDGRNWLARQLRADAYRMKRDFDAALADANEAVLLWPGEPDNYVIRARILMELRQWKDALEDLTHAIELDPDLENAYRKRSEVYRRLNDIQRALSDATKADELAAKAKKVKGSIPKK